MVFDVILDFMMVLNLNISDVRNRQIWGLKRIKKYRDELPLLDGLFNVRNGVVNLFISYLVVLNSRQCALEDCDDKFKLGYP